MRISAWTDEYIKAISKDCFSIHEVYFIFDPSIRKQVIQMMRHVLVHRNNVLPFEVPTPPDTIEELNLKNTDPDKQHEYAVERVINCPNRFGRCAHGINVKASEVRRLTNSSIAEIGETDPISSQQIQKLDRSITAITWARDRVLNKFICMFNPANSQGWEPFSIGQKASVESFLCFEEISPVIKADSDKFKEIIINFSPPVWECVENCMNALGCTHYENTVERISEFNTLQFLLCYRELSDHLTNHTIDLYTQIRDHLEAEKQDAPAMNGFLVLS